MSGPRPVRRDASAGVTLVEVLVALVLFALIGGAGFSVLDQVMRVQSRTDQRLEHIAQIQRAMQMLTKDFMQASGGSLAFSANAVSFRRSAGNAEISVRYGVEGEALVRSLSRADAVRAARQTLLMNVGSAEWSFYDPASDWLPTWPPSDADSVTYNPAAVALELVLTGPLGEGRLRRVAILPQDPTR